MSTKLDTDKLEPGCYIDGHWGQYGPARMLQMAGEMGWENEAILALAEKKLASMAPSENEELTADEEDQICDALDGAEQWLNDHAVPEDHSWEWIDGEFFLSALDWDDGWDDE